MIKICLYFVCVSGATRICASLSRPVRHRKSESFEPSSLLFLSLWAASLKYITFRESPGRFSKRLRRIAEPPRGRRRVPWSENHRGRPARSRKAFPYRPHLATRSFEISPAHEVDAQRTHCNASPGSRYLSWRASYRRRRPASTAAAAAANSQASRHSRERSPLARPSEERMESPPQR